MTNIYRLAERNIAVTSLYEEVHRLCAAYRVPDAAPDFVVRIAQADIDLERERSAREDAAEGRSVRQFPDSYLETLAVYRQIAERMTEYDTLLLHGSCVAVDGMGYLFTAGSGTGKSTHTRLWRELLGERAVMINDDKPLIRAGADGTAMVYGTPWDGKHRLSTNTAVPLRAVCILERAAENAIRPIPAGEAYPMLLQQAYRPRDAAALAKTLTLLDRLAGCVRFWRLGCNMDPEAARLAYEAMRP